MSNHEKVYVSMHKLLMGILLKTLFSTISSENSLIMNSIYNLERFVNLVSLIFVA